MLESMADGASMDYERVRRLAAEVAEAAGMLEEGRAALAGTSGDSEVTTGMFGNTGSAGACHSAHIETKSAGSLATQHLGTALSADEGRLRQVITTFQQVDHESADRLAAVATTSNSLNVYTTHVHSDSRGELGADDQERANQINTALDTLAETPGDTVFTGDLNIDYDSPHEGQDGVPEEDTESAQAVGRLESELSYENAGDAAGPTGNYGDEPTDGQIDYVFTSPGLVPDSENAQKVEGDPEHNQDLSDHDGIAVDIAVPRSW
jgi:hypothetical protein